MSSRKHSGARGGYALIPNPLLLQGGQFTDVTQVRAEAERERVKAMQERARQEAMQGRERSNPRRGVLHSNSGEEGPTREHLSKSRSKRRGSRNHSRRHGNESSESEKSRSSGRRKPGTRKNTAVSAAPVPQVFSVSSENEVMFVNAVNTAAEKAAAEAAEKEKRRAAKAKENARRKAIQNAQNARNSQIVKGSPFGTMRFGNNVNTWR
jgi:hypothetical protein